MSCRYSGVVLATLACVCAPAGADETKHFELELEGGRRIDGPKTLRVSRGDNVKIQWTADRPTTIHLHGYDIQAMPDKSQPQTMSFHARATGRFPIETHGGNEHRRVLI